jgi:Icc protein
MDARATVRALQITDLHLVPDVGASIYGADPHASLIAVLRAALALPARPDVIIATGDLSEDGSAESYRRLRDALLATELPTYVLPGNHDDLGRMRTALVGGSIQLGPVVELGSWRAVLLDSCVPGRPHGLLADAQLDLLSSVLHDDPRRPTLVALHHGPVPPCPSTGCRLHDAEVLLERLAASSNARAVIAGHAHEAIERRAGPLRLLTTPSTCAQAIHAQLGAPVDHEDFWASHRFDPSRHGFRLLALRPDGELESEVHFR